MKNILLVCLIIACSIQLANSQDYKSNEWDVLGVSRLIPTTNGIGSAVGLYTEVRFNVRPKVSLGLKYEWQFFDELFNEALRGAGITTSFSLTGDYYLFNKLNQRAFVGLGTGTYDNQGITESGEEVGGTGIGLSPRFGFEYNFLRFTVDYNQVFVTDFPNYFSLGVALNIGGRHK